MSDEFVRDVALNGELLRDLARFLRLPVEQVRQEPHLRLLPPLDDAIASRKAEPLRLVTDGVDEYFDGVFDDTNDKEVPF